MVFSHEDSDNERTTRTYKLGPPNPKVEETIKHISKGWIPVHPHILQVAKEITQRKNGIDRTLLTLNVKSDPGLYVFCARSVKQFSTPEAKISDPLELLQKLEEEKLCALFNVSEKELSIHQIKDSSRAQALRLQHSLVSSKTAETLAAHVKLPDDLAFNAASFRQLGLNLIAWNYPRIYARYALKPQMDQRELDTEILKILGLTPLQIGARFAGAWETTPKVRELITTSSTKSIGTEESKKSNSPIELSKILEISELFAKRRDPKHFPNAEVLWEKEQESLSKIFSLDLFEEIDEGVKETLSIYSKVAESIFSLPLGPQKVEIRSGDVSQKAAALAAQNRYFARCAAKVQIELLQVYEKVEDSKLSVGAISALVDGALPRIGFARGCLFLLAKNGRTLVPALRIGNRPLAEYSDFLKEPDNGVQASPHNAAPFEGDGIGITGKLAHHISGSLDARKNMGVLYLEVSDEDETSIGEMLPVIFKAIRIVLHHCLGLS